jgi:hypothetical protein
MDDNDAVTIWLVSILAVLIGSGFYRIWQGELQTPALLRQINDLQHQNAYLQAENTRLSPQSDNPPAPYPARGWFQILLWGTKQAPNTNIVQQQNSSLLRRIKILREQSDAMQQQFDALQQHSSNLEHQNDDLRNQLDNDVALDTHNLEQLRDWFADQIAGLEEVIKERDVQLHALEEEKDNYRTGKDDLRTIYKDEITRRDERIKHLEEESRTYRVTDSGDVSPIVLMQLETVLDQTRQSNSDLRTELKTVNEEIARLRDQLKERKVNAEAAAEKTACLEAENTNLTARLEMVVDSEQVAQLKADHSKAVAESGEREQDIEDWKTRYDQLDEHFVAQIQDLARETAAHRQGIEEINRLNGLIQELETGQNARLEQSQNRYDELDHQYSRERRALSEQSTKYRRSLEKIYELETCIEELETEKNTTNTATLTKEAEIKALQTARDRPLAHAAIKPVNTAPVEPTKGHLTRSIISTSITSPIKPWVAKLEFSTLLASDTTPIEPTSLVVRVGELESQLQTTTEERDTARKDLDQERLDRSGDADNRASEKNQLRAAQETAETQLQQAQTRVTDLEGELRVAKEEREPSITCDAEVKKKVLKLGLTEEKKTELEKSVEDLKGERDTLQQKLDTTSKSLEKCEEQRRQATLEREAKNKDIERLQAKIQRLENEVEEVSQRFTDCENNNPAPSAEKKFSFTGFEYKPQNQDESARLPTKDQNPGSDDELRTNKQPPGEEESLNEEALSSDESPAPHEQLQRGPAMTSSTHPANEITQLSEPTDGPLDQTPSVEKLGDVRANQQLSPTRTTTQPLTVIQLSVAAGGDANVHPGPHDLVCEPGCGYRIRALVAESIAQMNRHQEGCPDYQAEAQRVQEEAEQNPSGITCENCNQFWPRDLASFNEEHVGGRNPCTPDTLLEWQPYAGSNQPPDNRCDLCKETFPGRNRAWLKNEHWPECARKYQEEHGESNRKKRKLGNPVTCDNCGHIYYIGRHTSMNGFHKSHNDQCRKDNPRKNGNVKGRSRYEKIKCEHCGTQFSREEMFKDQVGHAYNCPMIPTLLEGKCRYYDAKFTSKDQLVKQHVQAGKCPQKPKKFKCMSCREEFAEQTDEWLKTVHLPKSPSRDPQSEDDRTCRNCKYVFLSKNDMFRHLGIGNSEPKQNPQCRKHKHVPPPKSWGARPPASSLTPTSPDPSQQGFGGRSGSSGPSIQLNTGTNRVGRNGTPTTPLNGGASTFTLSSSRPDSGHTTSIQALDSGHTIPSGYTQNASTYPLIGSPRSGNTQNNGSGPPSITPRAGGLKGSPSGPPSVFRTVVSPLNIQPMTHQKPTERIQKNENDNTDLYADPSPSHHTPKFSSVITSQNKPQPASAPKSQPPTTIQTSSKTSTTNNNVQNTGLAQPQPSIETTGGHMWNNRQASSNASRSRTAIQGQNTQSTQQLPAEQNALQPPPTETQTQIPVIGSAPKTSTSNFSTSAQAQTVPQARSQIKTTEKIGGLIGKSRWASDGAGASTSTTPRTGDNRQDERSTAGGMKPRQDGSGSIGLGKNTLEPPNTDKPRCTYCSSKNHTEANCGKRESDNKCPYCRQTDHKEVEQCPFKKSDEKKGKLREKCGYCPLWGHTEDVCTKKEKDIAFTARRGGNSWTGSGYGKVGARGRDGNKQGSTLPARGSIISYRSGSANTGTGTGTGAVPQTPRAGTATSAQNIQQAVPAQSRLDPNYDAKASRWADMDDDPTD